MHHLHQCMTSCFRSSNQIGPRQNQSQMDMDGEQEGESTNSPTCPREKRIQIHASDHHGLSKQPSVPTDDISSGQTENPLPHDDDDVSHIEISYIDDCCIVNIQQGDNTNPGGGEGDYNGSAVGSTYQCAPGPHDEQSFAEESQETCLMTKNPPNSQNGPVFIYQKGRDKVVEEQSLEVNRKLPEAVKPLDIEQLDMQLAADLESIEAREKLLERRRLQAAEDEKLMWAIYSIEQENKEIERMIRQDELKIEMFMKLEKEKKELDKEVELHRNNAEKSTTNEVLKILKDLQKQI